MFGVKGNREQILWAKQEAIKIGWQEVGAINTFLNPYLLFYPNEGQVDHISSFLKLDIPVYELPLDYCPFIDAVSNTVSLTPNTDENGK